MGKGAPAFSKPAASKMASVTRDRTNIATNPAMTAPILFKMFIQALLLLSYRFVAATTA
jgi:hypothetical protein